MKKTFPLTDPKITQARRIETIKADINKYIKRERRKTLPEGYDFWDFNCHSGENSEQKKEIHVAEISKNVDQAASNGLEAIYIEILAIPQKRKKKPKAEEAE